MDSLSEISCFHGSKLEQEMEQTDTNNASKSICSVMENVSSIYYHWPKQVTKPSPKSLGQGSRLSLEIKKGMIRSKGLKRQREEGED